MTTHVHAFGDDALGRLDAVGVAAEIAAGTISQREAVAAAIARIDAVNPLLNAVATPDYERALAAADTPHHGLLAGVPTMVKDNTDVAGLASGHGSLAVPDAPATRDAAFTRQIRAAGVIVLGKSTLPEFGLNATTEYADRPPTRNPWNTDYSCGASSGGSAALVASGAVPIAHANDGGGSIRIPAAACGLLGLKPTRGRVALAQGMEKAPVEIAIDGVVTRTVRDTATFFAAAERYQPARDLPPIGLVEGPGDRRLRVGLIVDSLDGNSPDAQTSAAVHELATRLDKLGHTVQPVAIPAVPGFEDAFVQYWALAAFSFDRLGKRQFGRDYDRARLDPFTLGLSKLFRRRPWRALQSIRILKASESVYRAAFGPVDVIVSPTLATTTPEIGHISPAGDFDEVFARLRRYSAYTPLNNATGGPAISLPVAQTDDGRPLGLHVMADHGDERTLLELAFELESEIGFARIDG